MVNQTGTPYAYTGGDPVNRSDPSGMCNDVQGVHVYDGACTGVQLAQIRQAAVQARTGWSGILGVLHMGAVGIGKLLPARLGSDAGLGTGNRCHTSDHTSSLLCPLPGIVCSGSRDCGGCTTAATESLVLGSLAATGLEGVCRLASNLCFNSSAETGLAACWFRVAES